MSGGDRTSVRKARVTVKDLARDLSLSTSTISRAFYTDAVIAPSTRKAVLTRAAEIAECPQSAGAKPDHQAHQDCGRGDLRHHEPFLSGGPHAPHGKATRNRPQCDAVGGRLERYARRRGEASPVLSARRGHRSRGDPVVRGRRSVRASGHAGSLLQPASAECRRIRRDLRQCRRRGGLSPTI